jgi:chromosome segregation ATPase
MSDDDGVIGLSTEAAVERLAGDERDPDEVRAALDPVTEDGVVSEAAIEESVSDTAKIVSTAETRTELADIAHDDAHETAAPVADVDAVAARLEAFDERFAAVERRAADLTTDLARPVGRLGDPAAVYELAVELREVASAAQGVATAADELSFDLEDFERWVGDPETRHEEFREDAELVGDSVDELAAAIEALDEAADPAVDWADATMRTRVLDLLVADLRAELADLRELAARDDATVPDDLAAEIDDLQARTGALARRLDELAEPAWRERFGGDVAALEADLDLVPPVEWGAVQTRLEEHRDAAFD